MNKLISGFFGEGGGLLASRQPERAKKCPTCGMTLDEFAENGMAGCPDCYTAFGKELEPTITRIQGKNRHVGRVQSGFSKKIEERRKIDALEAERREAVKNENYERAAEIRDELKRLRGE